MVAFWLAKNEFLLDSCLSHCQRRDFSWAWTHSTNTSAAAAQGAAAQALGRLVEMAERSHSGQIARVAQFLASGYNGRAFPFDLFDLRAVDVAISDDMLLCLDALRWGRADLYKLLPDGERRIQAVIDAWGLKWPDENT